MLLKTFKITERAKAEFSANATNLINHPSFALPDKVVGPGHIGRITATSVGSSDEAFEGPVLTNGGDLCL